MATLGGWFAERPCLGCGRLMAGDPRRQYHAGCRYQRQYAQQRAWRKATGHAEGRMSRKVQGRTERIKLPTADWKILHAAAKARKMTCARLIRVVLRAAVAKMQQEPTS